jgi:hypothetical protein
VEVIIGDLFFRDDEQLEDIDDDNEQNPANAARKKLIKKQNEKKNVMKLFCKKDDAPVYTVTIKDCLRFNLAMDYVGIGLSFRQTAVAIQKAKDRMKTTKLIGLNDCIVGQYTRVLVAVALQQIALILGDESVWAMSLAGDGSTHRGQSFFDLRLRVCYRGDLVNLHLVALPMFERHSAVNIFNLIAKFMDAMYSKWRSKLIGVSTDGENTMIGRHAGIVTRLIACADNNVLRIWCAPHQIDIVVKAAVKAIDNGVWVKQVYTFSIFLRAQDNLIIEMNVKCPKKTNRWAHLGRLLNFYISYRRLLLEYTQNKQPELMPSDLWWIITYAVALAIDSINITLVHLQARSLLIAQQETLVQNLIGTIIAMLNIEVDSADGDDALDDGKYVQQDSLRIPTVTIVNHIENQGSFSHDCYERLEEGDQQDVIKHIAMYAMALVAGLRSVKAERDSENRASERDVPPVLPAQLVKLRHGAFLKEVLDLFRQHISSSWSEIGVEQIEVEHRELLKLYASDIVLCGIIDKHNDMTTFNDAWDCAPDRFEHLRSFCGRLATVLANTTSVEFDFFVLKWEMDDNHTALMHLSLEGIFQVKQCLTLQTLLH